MDIQVPRIDGRTRMGDIPHSIIDGDTGNEIGTIVCGQGTWLTNKRFHSRTISLFNGKFRGSFETHAECVAFAKGVEAAINQMMGATERSKDHPSAKGYYEFRHVEPSA
ncbi:hypothetical protein [Bradyrhizobium ivorense]|uniref:hypothetical protein n=1 Tax=Bradyrhizobium ivorense TaxID=2511166 RepID=UPI0010B02273|nr:hypothetical protein [Bradyrhizobium ivorense]VIO71259.1 hypothetical protein CI41S_29300 [Bradyrhizobium ivorense]